jgi:carbonic anhydrase
LDTHSKETQEKLTPDLAFQTLKEGNERFIKNLKANRNLLQQANDTKQGQFPFATILSCMDSRTSAELIFDQGLGDILSIRIAGNILNDDILGSMEFATKVVGTKIILVLGHTHCGAIIHACNDAEFGSMNHIFFRIKQAIQKEKTFTENRNGDNNAFVDQVAEINVHLIMARIRQESLVISGMEKEGLIKLVGGVYNLETGKVNFFEE